MTCQNSSRPIKPEEFSFQMSQDLKLCDQRGGYTERLADLRDTRAY